MKTLLVSIDDLGLERMERTRTPYLDHLLATWWTHDRFVAAPYCSNFRAKVESGHYSIRPENLVGSNFKGSDLSGALPTGSHLIATAATGSTAQVGKWHLCVGLDTNHRSRAGYDDFGGSQSNLSPELLRLDRGGERSVYGRPRVRDGLGRPAPRVPARHRTGPGLLPLQRDPQALRPAAWRDLGGSLDHAPLSGRRPRSRHPLRDGPGLRDPPDVGQRRDRPGRGQGQPRPSGPLDPCSPCTAFSPSSDPSWTPRTCTRPPCTW